MACNELGISQRTLQRWRSDATPLEDLRPMAIRPTPKNKLSEEEIQAILEVVNQPESQSLPPSQVVPTLMDREIYIASESSFYRVLRSHHMQYHRGQSRKPTIRPLSTHCATGPNQVWMWHITWLPGSTKGIYYYLYLILDLFSRKIVAWEIWLEESAKNASTLVRGGVLKEQRTTNAEPLVLHSDNGSPMKGAFLLEKLYTLGITPSRCRPNYPLTHTYFWEFATTSLTNAGINF